MNLQELQSHWNYFGETDAMWAVLSAEGKQGNRWNPDEFFATGRAEIAAVMTDLSRLRHPKSRGAALDFGCGVGRLTQALGDHLDRVVGVDIAPSMVEQARRFNRHGDRCQYVVNDRDDLSAFPTGGFDLVYSVIVLQHIRPEFSRRYIKEFVRLLAPGGVAVFHVPSEWVGDAGRTVPVGHDDTPPLPVSGQRASLAIRSKPVVTDPGGPVEVTVAVTNRGNVVWQAPRADHQRRIRLGNHWRRADGEMVAYDDVRADLPADLPPGGETTFTLRTAAPRRPGSYLLELDMVQEFVAWFAVAGSEPASVAVEVKPTGEPTAAEPPAFPVMEMHGVPWLTVVQDVVSAGGAVLDVVRDAGSGGGWEGYRYSVIRRP